MDRAGRKLGRGGRSRRLALLDPVRDEIAIVGRQMNPDSLETVE